MPSKLQKELIQDILNGDYKKVSQSNLTRIMKYVVSDEGVADRKELMDGIVKAQKYLKPKLDDVERFLRTKFKANSDDRNKFNKIMELAESQVPKKAKEQVEEKPKAEEKPRMMAMAKPKKNLGQTDNRLTIENLQREIDEEKRKEDKMIRDLELDLEEAKHDDDETISRLEKELMEMKKKNNDTAFNMRGRKPPPRPADKPKKSSVPEVAGQGSWGSEIILDKPIVNEPKRKKQTGVDWYGNIVTGTDLDTMEIGRWESKTAAQKAKLRAKQLKNAWKKKFSKEEVEGQEIYLGGDDENVILRGNDDVAPSKESQAPKRKPQTDVPQVRKGDDDDVPEGQYSSKGKKEIWSDGVFMGYEGDIEQLIPDPKGSKTKTRGGETKTRGGETKTKPTKGGETKTQMDEMGVIEKIVGEKPQTMKEWMKKQYGDAKEELMPTEQDIKRYKQYIANYKDKFHKRVQDIKEGKTHYPGIPESERSRKVIEDRDWFGKELAELFGVDTDMTYEEALEGVRTGFEEFMDNTIGEVPIIGTIVEEGLLKLFDWTVEAQFAQDKKQGELDENEFQEIEGWVEDPKTGKLVPSGEVENVTHVNDPDYLPNFKPNYVFDNQYHRQALISSKNFINKVLESGELDYYDEEAYKKLKSVFSDVLADKKDYSYDTITKLQEQMIRILPMDVRTEMKGDIDQFIKNVKYSYDKTSDWRGKLDIGGGLIERLQTAIDGGKVYDPQQTETMEEDPDDTDPYPDTEEEEEDEGDDDEIKEKKIEPSGNKVSDNTTGKGDPRYRWRGRWGNTDDLFFRDEEDVAKRNLVIEVQNLKEQIDNNNELVKRLQMSYDMRFKKTYPMPNPQAPPPTTISQEWRKMTQPIMIPQYPPAQRPFEMNSRDEASFGQYQGWTNAYPDFINTRETMSNPLVNPSNADTVTHGIQQELSRQNTNWVMNERWAGRN